MLEEKTTFDLTGISILRNLELYTLFCDIMVPPFKLTNRHRNKIHNKIETFARTSRNSKYEKIDIYDRNNVIHYNQGIEFLIKINKENKFIITTPFGLPNLNYNNSHNQMNFELYNQKGSISHTPIITPRIAAPDLRNVVIECSATNENRNFIKFYEALLNKYKLDRAEEI